MRITVGMSRTGALLVGLSMTLLGGCNLDSLLDSSSKGTIPWDWVGGSSSVNATGSYGTEGAAGGAPGAREAPIKWIDASGNLWLFGGLGYDAGGTVGYLNDLWKYVPSTNTWTWVSGASTANSIGAYGPLNAGSTRYVPGGRESSASWIDAAGNLWLFGGAGYDSTGNLGDLNDLWKFSPATGEWTWVSGGSTVNGSGVYGSRLIASTGTSPGAREYMGSWIDSLGNFWLFGGSGYDVSDSNGALNDLWKFDPTTSQWTWVSGNERANQIGAYGSAGDATASNVPGGRVGPSYWRDLGGNLWILGGEGYDSTGTLGYLNDLWEYSPSSGLWTWVSGSAVADATGSYGTQGTAASGNLPGAREAGGSWVDAAGNFWLFGGEGVDSAGSTDYLNDLWKYSPSSGEWTWISGSSTVDASGSYGSKGTASEDVTPGARFASATWIDAAGNLWLFGGEGLDSSGNSGDLNDLWKATP